MVGWALAKSGYDSGLILLGRKVGLLPTLDASPWRSKMTASSWLLNLKETFHAAKFYMSLGKGFEAKTTKKPRLFHLNTVLGNYCGLSLICTLSCMMLALFCK